MEQYPGLAEIPGDGIGGRHETGRPTLHQQREPFRTPRRAGDDWEKCHLWDGTWSASDVSGAGRQPQWPDAGKLASLYKSTALGDIAVLRHGDSTIFDFGEFKSEVASRHNPDGTVSFITIVPGFTGLEFVMKNGEKPTLVTRDAQHEYVFTAQ